MNGEGSALGAGNRANATIGRALRLCCRNIAAARPGELDATTIGAPGHVQLLLYRASRIAVAAALGRSRLLAGRIDCDPVRRRCAGLYHRDGSARPRIDPRDDRRGSCDPGTYNAYYRRELWLVLSPDHANIICGAGWTKADVGSFIFQHARIPASFLRTRGSYGYHRDEPQWIYEGARRADPGSWMRPSAWPSPSRAGASGDTPRLSSGWAASA